MQENLYLIGFEKEGIKFELYLNEDKNEYVIRCYESENGYEMGFKVEDIKKWHLGKLLDDIVEKMIDDMKIFKGENK
jgi:hypothetical protein